MFEKIMYYNDYLTGIVNFRPFTFFDQCPTSYFYYWYLHGLCFYCNKDS